MRGVGIEGQKRARRGLPDGLADGFLHRGVHEDGGQHVLPLGVHVADLALEGAAHVLREHDCVLFLGAPLDERFEDAAQIADGYLFLHQPLEDFRDALRGQQPGGLAHEVGGALLHLVEQVLGFLHPEEGRGVPGQHEREVIGEDARVAHHADARPLQHGGFGSGHPQGVYVGQEAFALFELHAEQGEVVAAVAGEHHVFFQLAPGYGDFIDVEHVA